MNESDPSDDDALFAQYLRGESPSSKAYRLEARELPPAALDESIKAAARREVNARPETLRAAVARAKQSIAHSPFAGSWRVPLSLAAVLVVSVTLTLLMERDPDQSSVALPPRPQVATAPLYSPPQAPDDDSVNESAPLRSPVNESAPAQESTPTTVVPAEAAQRSPAPSGADSPLLANKREAAKQRAAVTPRMESPRESKTDARDPTNAQSDPVADSVAPADSSSSAELTRKEERADTAPSFDAKTASNPAPAPTDTLRLRDQRSASGQAQSEAEDFARAPAKWIADIVALQRAGKLPEAEKQLREFKKKFPAYAVPAELKDLEKRVSASE